MSTHHAVLYRAPTLEAVPALREIQKSSPDVRFFSADTLDIGTVRSIIDASSSRPVEQDQFTILIEARAVAIEAQHALLKILEEPPVTTRIVIVLPSSAQLLPTVLSRLVVEEVSQETGSVESEAFNSFLHCSYGERMTEIAARAKDKDVAWMREVMVGAETLAMQERDVNFKRVVLTINSYFGLRGASKKMLLEELALTIPVRNAKS